MALSTTALLERAKSLISSISLKKPAAQPMSVRRVGLNIGRFSLTASEISTKDKVHTLERAGHADLREGESVPEQIKKFWKSFGFESKRVNVSIKGKGVVIRFLNFPRMTREEFASSIQFEAEKYLP